MVYIGQSSNALLRWQKHVQALSRDHHVCVALQSEWNKFSGAHFSFEMVELVPSAASLSERENFWMKHPKFRDRLLNSKGHPDIVSGSSGNIGITAELLQRFRQIPGYTNQDRIRFLLDLYQQTPTHAPQETQAA